LPAHKGMGSYAVAEHTLADRFHVAAVTPASDLSSGPRHVTIVTTAALPWMTGTAVNPLLRAGQLAARGHEVTKDFEKLCMLVNRGRCWAWCGH